ncbi:hypothetical protein [Companilactobacillus mishanensis]|uniref:hypothetical protein n=1 Tax=Companilactobacillus mishanensis TaxID=2486008 RepID=UPI000F79E7DB|nr:hypothetical protein [Companilactobacillus mishanensis]
MTKIMQLSDFEGNRAYAKTHADDDSVEGLTKFVNNLIKGTSTNIDLTDYFTKEEIKQLLSDSIKNSLKDYYTKEEVKELMATGTDLSDYYTKEQIDSIIDKIPKADLSNYYTKADVDELIKQISSVDFSNYSTTDEMKKAIADAIAAYKPDMSNYYDKNEIDNKFAQSSGGSTDLSQYLTKDETINAVNDAIKEKLDDIYTKENIDDIVTTINGQIEGKKFPKAVKDYFDYILSMQEIDLGWFTNVSKVQTADLYNNGGTTEDWNKVYSEYYISNSRHLAYSAPNIKKAVDKDYTVFFNMLGSDGNIIPFNSFNNMLAANAKSMDFFNMLVTLREKTTPNVYTKTIRWKFPSGAIR